MSIAYVAAPTHEVIDAAVEIQKSVKIPPGDTLEGVTRSRLALLGRTRGKDFLTPYLHFTDSQGVVDAVPGGRHMSQLA